MMFVLWEPSVGASACREVQQSVEIPALAEGRCVCGTGTSSSLDFEKAVYAVDTSPA